MNGIWERERGKATSGGGEGRKGEGRRRERGRMGKRGEQRFVAQNMSSYCTTDTYGRGLLQGASFARISSTQNVIP